MVQITLRQVRELRGLSEQEVSEKTGISVRALQRWEKDCREIGVNEFMKLLDLYRISSNYVHIGAEDVATVDTAQANGSPFKGMHDNVIIAAVAGTDGLYSIHVKMGKADDYETFNRRLSLTKTLTLVRELRETLNLPKRAAHININYSVLNVSSTVNREFKRYFAREGVCV